MTCFHRFTGLAVLLLAGGVLAAEPVHLLTAQDLDEKVEKESVTILPRGADGKFGKAITLKLTGTSKITALSMQKRGDKLVPVQNEAKAKDLQPKQPVAVIYTGEKEGLILLSAVVQDK